MYDFKREWDKKLGSLTFDEFGDILRINGHDVYSEPADSSKIFFIYICKNCGHYFYNTNYELENLLTCDEMIYL
jgi:formylmethanofuran dehydrogenase subunit E